MILATVLTSSVLALSACGGSDPLNLQADSFQGGSLSNFGGLDGADTEARDIAREMAVGRNFDFTPGGGFTLSSGPINSTSDGGDFGIGGGTLDLSGDDATVDLDITSENPNVTNAHMVGTFSLAAASAAIANPSSSFDVEWTISFDTFGGIPVELTATQTLTGTDFSEE
jgi:hypothetical protein